MRRQTPPVVPIRIADPPDTIGRRVRVTVAETGREILLPNKEVEFLPGHVMLPIWLYRHLKKYLVAGPPGGI